MGADSYSLTPSRVYELSQENVKDVVFGFPWPTSLKGRVWQADTYERSVVFTQRPPYSGHQGQQYVIAIKDEMEWEEQEITLLHEMGHVDFMANPRLERPPMDPDLFGRRPEEEEMVEEAALTFREEYPGFSRHLLYQWTSFKGEYLVEPDPNKIQAGLEKWNLVERVA